MLVPEKSNQSEYNNLQREAQNRVRQMEQSNRKSRSSPMQEQKNFDKKENTHAESPVEMHLPQSNSSGTDSMPSLLDIIMKDKEKSLIILLIMILAEEKAPSETILALMYLII